MSNLVPATPPRDWAGPPGPVERVEVVHCAGCRRATVRIRQRWHEYRPDPRSPELRPGAPAPSSEWLPRLPAALLAEGWVDYGLVGGGRQRVTLPDGRTVIAEVEPTRVPTGFCCGLGCSTALARRRISEERGHMGHAIEVPAKGTERAPDNPVPYTLEWQLRQRPGPTVRCSYRGCTTSPLTLPLDASRHASVAANAGWLAEGSLFYCGDTHRLLAQALGRRQVPEAHMVTTAEHTERSRHEAAARERQQRGELPPPPAAARPGAPVAPQDGPTPSKGRSKR